MISTYNPLNACTSLCLGNWVVDLSGRIGILRDLGSWSSLYILLAYLLPLDVQIECLSLLSLARGGVIALNVFNPLIPFS